jgi:formylglycine-generating enzyme
VTRENGEPFSDRPPPIPRRRRFALPPARKKLSAKQWLLVALGGLAVVFAAWLMLRRPSLEWPTPIEVSDPSARILARMPDWQAASADERIAAAQAVDLACAEFSFLEVRRFTCLDEAFDIGVFEHTPTGLEFSLIPAGTFEMGAPAGERLATSRNTPAHQVTLTQPFLICRTLVTVAAWNRIAYEGHDLPQFWDNPGAAPGGLKWIDAKDWSITAGLDLPTEAEFEYAARAGTRRAYYFRLPDDRSERPTYDIVPPYLGPVPQKAVYGEWEAFEGIPNAFGLHKMWGIAQWVRDGCDPYPAGPVVDPVGSSRGPRMCRGSAPLTVFDHGMDLDHNVPVWHRAVPDIDEDFMLYSQTSATVRPIRRISLPESH